MRNLFNVLDLSNNLLVDPGEVIAAYSFTETIKPYSLVSYDLPQFVEDRIEARGAQ